MINSAKRTLCTTTAAIGLAIGIAQPAVAQDNPKTAATDADSGEGGVITVTARKQEEKITDVPIAITALSGEQLYNRNVKTFEDLSNYTPSLKTNVASAGGARVDRSSQLFIIRGMTPSDSLSPTTSLFINSVPLAASNFLQNIDDVERVEVLKGPQAAYFGRGTFAGAVNVVPRRAGFDFAANASLEVATRDTVTASASVTLPIIDDHVSVRVGGYYDRRDGSYDNTLKRSETLGDQKTTVGHIALTVNPADNFRIKAFGIIFDNKDGPAATGLILASGASPALAPRPGFDQSNCAVNGQRFFCGTLPGLSSATPAQNTTITAAQTAFLGDPGGIIDRSDIVQGYGLKRLGHHGDVTVEWDIPGTPVTVSYLGGFSNVRYSSISDLSNIDSSATGQYPGYAGFPFLVERKDRDYSHEGRVFTDTTSRFRAMAGVSYLNLRGEAINFALSGATLARAPLGSPTKSETTGFFGSLGYDITDQFTVTAEGRYQIDTQRAFNVARVQTAKGTSKDFLPRVSLEFKPTKDLLVYATYSKGLNPGVFNSQFNSLPAASQATLLALGAAGRVAVLPERLTNYEAGFKGSFAGGRATVALIGYYSKWKDQLSSNVYNFAATDPANPRNIPGASQFNPVPGIFTYSYRDNSASSTAKGIEFEATVRPVRYVTVDFASAINDIKYDAFNCASCAPYPTVSPFFNAAGKRLPNSPKYTTAVGAQYEQPISFLGATSFFGRVDYIYRGSMFIQASNTVEIPSAETVNIRAGIDFNKIRVEGFVNNLFNDRTYTTGFQNTNFGGGFTQTAVMVGLPRLVTVGGRVSIKF